MNNHWGEILKCFLENNLTISKPLVKTTHVGNIGGVHKMVENINEIAKNLATGTSHVVIMISGHIEDGMIFVEQSVTEAPQSWPVTFVVRRALKVMTTVAPSCLCGVFLSGCTLFNFAPEIALFFFQRHSSLAIPILLTGPLGFS